MYLEDDIPSRVRVLRYPCRVWYRSQPKVCYICEKATHVAADCPLRGLCRKCRKPGHIARDCDDSPEGPPRSDDPPAPPAADVSSQPEPVPPQPSSDVTPPVPDVDDASSDSSSDSSRDSSESMDEDVLASGDEEVLANAPPQTGSPRRTRSSTARAVSPIPGSVPVSLPSFPPSGAPASVPDVPASDAPDVPASDVPPEPMSNSPAGFFPPVFSSPVPVRSAPPDLRDAILASHSTRSMFRTEKFVPLEGSSPVESYSVFDFDFMTCAVLQDNATFESVREEFYAGRPSPGPSVMPDVPRSVDLPPLLPCVTPAFFVDPVLAMDVSNDDLYGAFFSPDPALDPLTFTVDDVVKLFPSTFSSLPELEQQKIVRNFCGAEYRATLDKAVLEHRLAS